MCIENYTIWLPWLLIYMRIATVRARHSLRTVPRLSPLVIIGVTMESATIIRQYDRVLVKGRMCENIRFFFFFHLGGYRNRNFHLANSQKSLRFSFRDSRAYLLNFW